MTLTILAGADKRKDDWAFENGREVVWYDENPVTKHVIMTSPFHPFRLGYNRHKTNQPKEMDRIFDRLNAQEREHNQQLIEKLWNRGRAQYEALRSRLYQRLLSAEAKEWEKAFIRESLRLMDDRDHEAQKNHRFGVSSMQEAPALLEGARTRVN